MDRRRKLKVCSFHGLSLQNIPFQREKKVFFLEIQINSYFQNFKQVFKHKDSSTVSFALSEDHGKV